MNELANNRQILDPLSYPYIPDNMHEKVLFVSNIRKVSTEIQGKVHRKKIIFYVKFMPVKVNWFQDERRSDKRRSGQT